MVSITAIIAVSALRKIVLVIRHLLRKLTGIEVPAYIFSRGLRNLRSSLSPCPCPGICSGIRFRKISRAVFSPAGILCRWIPEVRERKEKRIFPGKNCGCPGSVQVISPSMSERSFRISIQMISSFFSRSFTFTFRLMIPVTGDASRETDADE